MHLKINNQGNQVSNALLPWTCWVTSASYLTSLSLSFLIVEMGFLAGMQRRCECRKAWLAGPRVPESLLDGGGAASYK